MGNNRRIFRKVMAFIGACGLLVLCSCGNDGSGSIPTGSLDDVMKDAASFYSIRGGSDYDRLPLRYPFHIVDTTGEPLLCNGRVVVVENVTAVNVHSNLIFGTYGSTEAFGKVHLGGWFIVEVSSHTNLPAAGEAEFVRTLAANGVTNQVLRSIKPLIKEFMHNGTLPFGR
ncbi:MAG: hypothetical protein M9920_16065 [Verrucomicrobiae bacterium]|nr:hypothetical protein [Verrucomicrobiae bacterium]